MQHPKFAPQHARNTVRSATTSLTTSRRGVLVAEGTDFDLRSDGTEKVVVVKIAHSSESRLVRRQQHAPQRTEVIAFQHGLARRTGAGHTGRMAYEYRVTEAEDGTFPVELWSSKGGREQLVYKTRGFQTRQLAEAWIVPVEVQSGDPPQPRARVTYLKPRRSRVVIVSKPDPHPHPLEF